MDKYSIERMEGNFNLMGFGDWLISPSGEPLFLLEELAPGQVRLVLKLEQLHKHPTVVRAIFDFVYAREKWPEIPSAIRAGSAANSLVRRVFAKAAQMVAR